MMNNNKIRDINNNKIQCKLEYDTNEAINKPQCCLCPIKGCALKQTKSGGFAHVSCALWINGIDIANLKTMNPICGVLKVQEMQTPSAIKIHTKMLQHGLEINNGIKSDIDADNECFIDGICEWSHKCIVCGDDNGCFIECSDNKCIYRMHVLCAWFSGYHMRIDIVCCNVNGFTSLSI